MKIKRKKIVIFGGTRPNFIKIAPLLRELKKQKRYFRPILVNTNQHTKYVMNKCFFEDLNMSKPDFHIQSDKKQIDKVLKKIKPDIACVVGDVNSTLEAAVSAKRLNIKLAHIEAGLRSFDRSMPEEINRIATDAISDYFFITEESAKKNLIQEGHSKKKIFFVGNLMIDNLFHEINKTKNLKQKTKKAYGVLTLHRPSNVDSKKNLKLILKIIKNLSFFLDIIFPVHPRTKRNIKKLNLKIDKKIKITGPLRFPDFLNLIKNAKIILTDSGGLQEESTALGIPCITLRKNTERPITTYCGTNKVLGLDEKTILERVKAVLNKKTKFSSRPPMWDGKSAKRIVNVLKYLR